jgi:hypothetical protein
LYLFAVMADSLLALDKFVIRPVPAAIGKLCTQIFF